MTMEEGQYNIQEGSLLNLFYLDEDMEKCAEYHVDSHVVKMVTEAAQLLTTTVWVDKLLGHVPRMLNKEELGVLKDFKAQQPSIEERTFTRFLPTHPNHPCAVWTRTSLSNYLWTMSYCRALNTEYRFRYRKSGDHKSWELGASVLPELRALPDEGLTLHALAMPDDYKHEGSPVECYRMYYMMEKMDMAVWKRRSKPEWWDERIVQYSHRDPHECYLNTIRSPTNKNKPHSEDLAYAS